MDRPRTAGALSSSTSTRVRQGWDTQLTRYADGTDGQRSTGRDGALHHRPLGVGVDGVASGAGGGVGGGERA